MNRLEIKEREPCPEWEPMDDHDLAHYCKNCGGQWIAHEPQLSTTLDAMARL